MTKNVYSVFFVAAALCVVAVEIVLCQLVVNVKNNGGDQLRESIQANTTQDTVTLEFQRADGTLVTLFIDFRNEVQIFRAIILGEEERGQSGYQVICFVARFVKNEFISSDAMSKLRQKNPGAIRHPEDDKGVELLRQDLLVRLDHAYLISPYISSMCQEAPDSTYTRDDDLKAISRTLGKDYSTLLGATKGITSDGFSRCREAREMWQGCTCEYQVCIGWYPCGLKYCKGRDSSGKVVSYRCGIKTCSMCRRFEYGVEQKQFCIWDEPDVPFPSVNMTESLPTK